MKKVILRLCLVSSLLIGLIISTSVQAEQQIKNIEKIKKVIAARLGGIQKFDIHPSPIKGLYLIVAPPRVLYISDDAKYIIDGDVSNAETGEDYTTAYRNASRFAAVEEMKDTMIVFSPPKDKVKHTITVFTDMDCYYCQKLHKEMADYNRLGIKVRYLAYPRQGLQSASYKKAVTVWCSKDKKAALTKAKNGEKLKPLSCDNPVAKHYALGNLLGVHGTPALLLENGQLYPGYVPAARLAEALDRMKSGIAKQ